MRQRRLSIWLLAGCAPTVVLDETPTQDCLAPHCLEHKLADYAIGPYEEFENVCMSWTIGNDGPLAVNAVTAINDGAFHHSNWFWVPESQWDLPDGAWDCNDHDFTELGAALAGGVIFAQSTQVAEETQRFLPGVVTEVGSNARIVAWTHLLNPTGETVDTSMTVRLDILDESEVITRLAPIRLTYYDLDIPAGADTDHRGRCNMENMFESVAGHEYDIKLHYALSHFHGLGTGFRLSALGGERDGEVLLQQEDAIGHALGNTFEVPIDLKGTTGLDFSCYHRNNTDEDVGWGIGDQEMCVMLGFIESDVQFDVNVGETLEVGEDGEVLTRTGDCSVLGFPFRP